jgi:uncharacterized protein (DUF2141 family)
MINFLVIIISIALNFFSPDGNNNSNSKLKITIKIQGLKSNNGSVKVALCNSKENYYNHKFPFIGLTLPIMNRQAEVTLTDISPGFYAVKVFHDENNNDNLDTNLFGIPVEDYGFSNNSKSIFGIPGWNKAKLLISEGSSEIIIDLR